MRRLFSQGRHQPKVVEGRRPQRINEAANIGDRGLCVPGELLEEPIRRLEIHC